MKSMTKRNEKIIPVQPTSSSPKYNEQKKIAVLTFQI